MAEMTEFEKLLYTKRTSRRGKAQTCDLRVLRLILHPSAQLRDADTSTFALKHFENVKTDALHVKCRDRLRAAEETTHGLFQVAFRTTKITILVIISK